MSERTQGSRRRRRALTKFKQLAKAFRREANHWKDFDTSIAKARQYAFEECASDVEAAVRALELDEEQERGQ